MSASHTKGKSLWSGDKSVNQQDKLTPRTNIVSGLKCLENKATIHIKTFLWLVLSFSFSFVSCGYTERSCANTNCYSQWVSDIWKVIGSKFRHDPFPSKCAQGICCLWVLLSGQRKLFCLINDRSLASCTPHKTELDKGRIKRSLSQCVGYVTPWIIQKANSMLRVCSECNHMQGLTEMSKDYMAFSTSRVQKKGLRLLKNSYPLPPLLFPTNGQWKVFNLHKMLYVIFITE